MDFTVGSDVGGTFTDLWVTTDASDTRVFKTPTTADVRSGIIDAMRLAAMHFGVSFEHFCASISRFGHGTTVGLNALLTNRAARTAILTTQGFADTLEIGRLTRQSTGLNEHEYTDSYLRNRFAPIVPRELIFEVDERIDAAGKVTKALDERSARRAVEAVKQAEVEAVAICLLFGTINPAHERRLLDLVTAEIPHAFVSASHLVCPSVGEYARMSTTAANAALGPIAGGYLHELESTLRAAGLRVPVLMMTCGGGVLPTAALNDRPVNAIFSGPAGCVKASQIIGQRLGTRNILSTDIGGTSFDVGVIVDGEPIMRSDISLAGADLRVHSIDIQSIGAGGGSIAWIDSDGALKVGPQSAGASPGPACYGRGGLQPTATDADLVLGVLDPDTFIGGAFKLDVAAARAAIQRIAEPLGLTIEHAAWGIRRILDNRMADLLRRVTIEKGYAPEDFALMANGGAGPSHAWALAAELGLSAFIVPATATALSAMGTACANFQLSVEAPVYIRLQHGRDAVAQELETLRQAAGQAEADVRRQLQGAVSGHPQVDLSIATRFLGQTHFIDVPIAPALDVAALRHALADFQARYSARFGQAAAAQRAGFEIVALRAVGRRAAAVQDLAARGSEPIRLGSRAVILDDPRAADDCAVWQAVVLPQDWRVAGPAIIEFPGQTVVVPARAVATADVFGNIHVRLGA